MKKIPGIAERTHQALKKASDEGKVGRYDLYKEIAESLGCSWQTVRRYARDSCFREKVGSRAGRVRSLDHEKILSEILTGKKKRKDIAKEFGCHLSVLSKIFWDYLMKEGK